MKLKKSFLANLRVFVFVSVIFLSFSSCESTNFSVPIPGQNEVKQRNIYVEYYNLGEAYFKLEDYKKASEYYALAMKKKEQYWAAYYKLAKCYVYNSEWNKALPMYKKMLERDTENASLKASVAYLYSMQGDLENAFIIYDELLKVQPTNQDYLENYLAIILADEKKLKNNPELFTTFFETLKTEYPENKNLESFETKYKTILNIKDEVSEEAEENADSESENENQ